MISIAIIIGFLLAVRLCINDLYQSGSAQGTVDTALLAANNTWTGTNTFAPSTTTGGATSLTLTAPTRTAIPTTAECTELLITLGTQTWATGTVATQRFIHITAPTVAFASASTMTSTATLTIDGAPIQGTNATLTKTMALNVVAGLVNIGGTLTVAGVITSTQATGTAPFTVASTTQVANLNVSQLVGATWTAPGTIGSGTPNTGAFTTISATGAVTFTPAAISTGTRRAFVVTGAADTTITSATEQIDVYLNLSRTVQWATSTPTTQRAILVDVGYHQGQINMQRQSFSPAIADCRRHVRACRGPRIPVRHPAARRGQDASGARRPRVRAGRDSVRSPHPPRWDSWR